MPNPKRRHCSTRRDKRRAHDALTVKSRSSCAQCGDPKLPHRVCTNCGHYAGKKVLATAAE